MQRVESNVVRGVVVLGCLLAGGWVSAQPDTARSSELAALLEVLHADPPRLPRDRDHLAERIAVHGKKAIPFMWAAWLGGGWQHDEELTGSEATKRKQHEDAVHDVAILSLDRLQARGLHTFLVERIEAAEDQTHEILLALRLLGDVGRSTSLGCLAQVVLLIDDVAISSHITTRQVRFTTQRVLERDPAGFSRLRFAMQSLPEKRALLMLQGIEDAGGQASQAFLVSILGRYPSADPDLVLKLSEQVRELGDADRTALASFVAGGLRGTHAALRRSAVVAAQRLQEPACIEPLILCLDEEDGALRDAALRALRGLTGRSYGTRSTAWLAWWQEELHWWEDIGRSALEQLNERDPGAVLDAINAIRQHVVFGREIALELLSLLDSRDVRVRRVACAALVGFRSQVDSTRLGHVLRDPDPRVRVSAARILGMKQANGM
ncbi:MAG: hypothetical protein H6834_16590 [Planctomycetes bacterium]|nr:hypothetical protein [Planctomycetota bacterium]